MSMKNLFNHKKTIQFLRDVEEVLHKIFSNELPPLILVGHSMGGAIAVRTAHLPSLVQNVQGIAVIDVVEGNFINTFSNHDIMDKNTSIFDKL